MTKDEIIAIAVEAGLIRVGDGWTEPHRWGLSELEAFAKLVASAARNMTFTQAHWTDYERSIVSAEREACAMLCEDEAWRLKKLAVNTGSSSTNTKAIQASNDAAAIRARGYLYEQGQPSAQI